MSSRRNGSPFEADGLESAAARGMPARLVGRSGEQAALHAAFKRAREDGISAVLVQGHAGTGKTALVNSLAPAVEAAGGWFVYGKADQFQTDAAATGVVTHALRGIAARVANLPDRELEIARGRIVEAAGKNAGLVTQLLPQIAPCFGPLPALPDVDPRQAEARFLQIMHDLLCAAASRERPIVMVLDGLQWAGAPSLHFFERVMNSPVMSGVMIVGCFRPTDARATNHLTPFLDLWRQQANPPVLLCLNDLEDENVGELIADVLQLPQTRATQLAKLLAPVARGNPFDITQVLDELRRMAVLRLEGGTWTWENAAVARCLTDTSALKLLAGRIRPLPPPPRDVLEFISCLGGAVEFPVLQSICDVSAAQLVERLEPLRREGLLAADTGEAALLGLPHDRVQQAVIDQMSAEHRSRVQLHLARRLSARPGQELMAAQHCLESIHLRTDANDKREAAQVLFEAGRQLAALSNHGLAKRYLRTAKLALSASSDRADALLDAIDSHLFRSLYSTGELHEMDVLFESIEARTTDLQGLVELACIRMRSLDSRARSADALELGLRYLEAMGASSWREAPQTDTDRRLDALGDWVREDSAIHHTQRPRLLGATLLQGARLLQCTVRSAFVAGDLKAMVWLLLECQDMWNRHGPCPDLVVSLARLSFAMIRTRGDYRTGFLAARHVVEVGEALQFEPQTSEARGIYVAYACSWFEPLEIVHEQAIRAFEGLRAYGDYYYACFVHRSVILAAIEIAPSLDIVAAHLEAGLAMSDRAGNRHAASLSLCERQAVRALRGLTHAAASLNDDDFDESRFEAIMHAMPHAALNYHVRRAWLSLIFGDMGALHQHVEAAQALSGTDVASEDLILASAVDHASQVREVKSGLAAQVSISGARLQACLEWFAARAADQPYNFLHLLRLVEAEQAYSGGSAWKAAIAYDAAVSEAHTRDRPWHKALITERAGLFHLAHGLAGTGRRLLGESLNHYRAWGASAKVEQMLDRHDFLVQAPQAPPAPEPSTRISAGLSAVHSVRGSSGGMTSDTVDLMGVLRASQALSSETSVERLTARVTQVLASLSGATKVTVLSWQEADWVLLAPAPGEPSLGLSQAARRGLLPLSVVQYVDRTGEALVVDDAPRDDRFTRDPYFAGVPLCSLLVAPISGQGGRAMLLLESRASRGAFGSERLDAVMLIAGQLAVSLANAQLYENLEQRVNARTRELEQTQSQLVTTARRAGKAEIANNVLHNVGNVLNSVNVSASVVRRTISESRAHGLGRAIGLLNEHHEDLASFMHSDPRGKALLPYLNEVVDALRREREGALEDLDRLSSSVDHITYVVSNQQSHAGPSSVLEEAHPGELMEEALRLSAESLVRYKVAIQRRYEDLPPATLDRQRILQILVNLIANAGQAMQGLPEEDRKLTLIAARAKAQGFARETAEGAEKLHFTVQDAGEGIEEHNLKQIFAHGFTTRKSGHGFGLHSAAVAAMEMGGKLTVHSDGPGQGARFTVELPLQRSRQ